MTAEITVCYFITFLIIQTTTMVTEYQQHIKLTLFSFKPGMPGFLRLLFWRHICVCVSMCPPPRLLITTWNSVKQTLQFFWCHLPLILLMIITLVTKHIMTTCQKHNGDTILNSYLFHARSDFYACTLVARPSTSVIKESGHMYV